MSCSVSQLCTSAAREAGHDVLIKRSSAVVSWSGWMCCRLTAAQLKWVAQKPLKSAFCFASLTFKDLDVIGKPLSLSLSLDCGRGSFRRESYMCKNSNSEWKTCWWEALSHFFFHFRSFKDEKTQRIFIFTLCFYCMRLLWARHFCPVSILSTAAVTKGPPRTSNHTAGRFFLILTAHTVEAKKMIF